MYGWREIHRYIAIPKPAAPAADLGQAATGTRSQQRCQSRSYGFKKGISISKSHAML